MVAWRVEVLYPTGRQDKLKWHDGFVMEEVRGRQKGRCERVHIMFEDGYEDWFHSLEDDAKIAFHKTGPCSYRLCACNGAGGKVDSAKLNMALKGIGKKRQK